jgi:hypothetical protein
MNAIASRSSYAEYIVCANNWTFACAQICVVSKVPDHVGYYGRRFSGLHPAFGPGEGETHPKVSAKFIADINVFRPVSEQNFIPE